MRKYKTEFNLKVCECAVCMVPNTEASTPSFWASIGSIARKIGCEQQTLNAWFRQHGVNQALVSRMSGNEKLVAQVVFH